MKDRTIADYTQEEFDALRKRLESARDALRRDNCLLQSVARSYYGVYVLASFAGGKHGVRATHIRRGERVTIKISAIPSYLRSFTRSTPD